MTLTRALRWLAPVAVAAAVTGMSAAPGAAAQPDPVSLQVFVADTVVPAGDTAFASFHLAANRATTLTDFRITFELADLAGLATIEPESISNPCTASGTQLICESDFEQDVDQTGIILFDIEFDGDPGASPGVTGVLPVTVEAAGVAPATYESSVTVGAPVDLVADGSGPITGSPGETVALPLTVHNAGPEPAQGVSLRFFKEFVLRPQTLHSNCVYLDGGEHGVLCTFDVTLEPGTTYTFAEPLEILIGEDAAAPGFGIVEATWLTRAEGIAWLAEVAHFGDAATPGDGPELGLVEADGGAPSPAPADPLPAADVDPENNWSTIEVTVEGDNQHDFAAVGAELSGDAGDAVDIQVGVANVGTATADASRAGEPVNLVRVTLPDGVTAVAVSGSCGPIREDGYDFGSAGEPGHAAYICATDTILPAGESVLFDFTLRIDEVIADAAGAVQVNQPPAPGESSPEDGNPGNDTAEIVANAGGGGGGLPVTGAAPGVVALAGLLLIGLGGAGVLLFRHRRTRFVA
jgi:hypothetical protein